MNKTYHSIGNQLLEEWKEVKKRQQGNYIVTQYTCNINGITFYKFQTN